MSSALAVLSIPWVGTALGAILTTIFYLRARKVGRISYEIIETTIVGTTDAAFSDHLKILFRDALVPRVTSTRVIIWNSANVTIRRADIAENDPLSLILGGDGRILVASIDKKTRIVNAAGALVGSTNRDVSVSFDFIDPNDGFTVTVIHSEDKDSLGIKGTIIGLSGGFKRVEDTALYPMNVVYLAAIILIPATVAAEAIVWMLPHSDAQHVIITTLRDMLIFVGGIAVALVAIISMLSRSPKQRFGWRRAPSSLQ